MHVVDDSSRLHERAPLQLVVCLFTQYRVLSLKLHCSFQRTNSGAYRGGAGHPTPPAPSLASQLMTLHPSHTIGPYVRPGLCQSKINRAFTGYHVFLCECQGLKRDNIVSALSILIRPMLSHFVCFCTQTTEQMPLSLHPFL